MPSLLRALRIHSALSRRTFATFVESEPIASASTSSASIANPPGKWSPYTQRTGVIAQKRGMTGLWDQDGVRYPVTVLQLDSVQVLRHTPPPPTSPLHSLQIGASDRSLKSTTWAQQGHFRKAGVNPKYKVQEFQVTEDAVLKVGTTLSAAHFVPGQYVDVTATSIGKGFAGVMKRHNFKGLKASHGVSVTHRSGGSTGQHQDPGRVLPGKKMAGHMGVVKRTTQNLLVHRIDTALNLVFLRGCVPGVDDAFVSVRDSKKKVTYKGMSGLKKGKEEGEWLANGVKTLPVPAGDVERATREAWPQVVEWKGRGEVEK
ncbi:large subunit ribosomal protein L3, partial [Tremellales sp. Uapishka_1]